MKRSFDGDCVKRRERNGRNGNRILTTSVNMNNENSNTFSVASSRTIVPAGFESVAHPVFRSQTVNYEEQQMCDCCGVENRSCRKQSFPKRQRHIECPICFGPCHVPVTPDSCPHTFCLNCIRLWARQCYKLGHLPNCPVCKRRIRTFINMKGETVALKLFPDKQSGASFPTSSYTYQTSSNSNSYPSCES